MVERLVIIILQSNDESRKTRAYGETREHNLDNFDLLVWIPRGAPGVRSESQMHFIQEVDRLLKIVLDSFERNITMVRQFKKLLRHSCL